MYARVAPFVGSQHCLRLGSIATPQMRLDAKPGTGSVAAKTKSESGRVQIVTWPPLEVPLLPVVLARRGNFAEATRIAHGWADRQIRAGNVQGAAIATLQVAQLLLDARHADSALASVHCADNRSSSAASPLGAGTLIPGKPILPRGRTS